MARSSGVNLSSIIEMLLSHGLQDLLLSVGWTSYLQSLVLSNQVFPNPLSLVEFIRCSQSFQIELRMVWEAPSTED